MKRTFYSGVTTTTTSISGSNNGRKNNIANTTTTTDKDNNNATGSDTKDATTTTTNNKDWIDYRKLEEYILNQEVTNNAFQRAIDSMKHNSGYYYASYHEDPLNRTTLLGLQSGEDYRMEYDTVKCTCPYMLEYLPETIDLKYVQRVRRIPTNHRSSSKKSIHRTTSSSRGLYDDMMTTTDDDGPSKTKSEDEIYNPNKNTKFDTTTAPEYEWVFENPITALHMISQVVPFNVLSNNVTMSIEKVFDYAGTGTFTPTSSSTTTTIPPQQPVWYGEEQERTILTTTEGYPQLFHPLIDLVEDDYYPDPLPENTIQHIVNTTYRPPPPPPPSSYYNNVPYQPQQPPPTPNQPYNTAVTKGSTIKLPSTGLKHNKPPPPPITPPPPPPPSTKPNETTAKLSKPKQDSISSISKKETSDTTTPKKKEKSGNGAPGTTIPKGTEGTASSNKGIDPNLTKTTKKVSTKKGMNKLPITKGSGEKSSLSPSKNDSNNNNNNNKSSSSSPSRSDTVKGATSATNSGGVIADPVVSSSSPPRTNNSQLLPVPTKSSSLGTSPQRSSTSKESGVALVPSSSSTLQQQHHPPTPPPPPVIVPPIPDPVYWSILSRNEHIETIQRTYLSKRGPYVPPGGNTPVSPVKTMMMNNNNPTDTFSYQQPSKKSKLPTSATVTGAKNKSNPTSAMVSTNTSKSKSKNRNFVDSHLSSTPGFHGGPLTIRQYLQIWKDNQTKNLFQPSYPMKLVPVGTNKVMLPIPASSFVPPQSLLPAPGSRGAAATTVMTPADEQQWKEMGLNSITKVELWMENYRFNRTSYWQRCREKEQQQLYVQSTTTTVRSIPAVVNEDADNTQDVLQFRNSERKLYQIFGSIQDDSTTTNSSFRTICPSKNAYNDDSDLVWSSLFGGKSNDECYNDKCNNDNNGPSLTFHNGDEYMQCLECTFIGLAPGMKSSDNTPKLCHHGQHIFQHMLQSNHNFAVSCGPKARIYSFKTGDYIYHRVFDQEKYRIDIMENIPVMGWNKHPINRSFDIFQFIHIPGQGIFWNGIKATYPVPVPREHLKASYLCRQRQLMFGGNIDELSLVSKVNANKCCIEFTALQNRRHVADRCRITAPIGFYNLGHTCAMSAVLQCLIHCAPLQKFFLHNIGFHYEACRTYRQMAFPELIPILETGNDNLRLASEMDKLFLRYFSSTIGYDVFSAIRGSSNEEVNGTSGPAYLGQPLLLNDMLTTVWRCRGMRHLAGYDQRDAHEFLHAFLDNLGKGTQTYYNMIQLALNRFKIDSENEPADNKDKKSSYDIIKKLFEGTLRSILVCQECGNKRVQLEPFLSISLPLSKEVQKLAKEIGDNRKQPGTKLSIDRCLKHFTMAEQLADHVYCPACAKKTPTKKQHVVARLPKVLCLHLKRFDASLNRKIEDFVSFPGRGLNMGPYLPHWSEVSKALTDVPQTEGTLPNILYDLFGTVNHHGNLESGHYVANVRIRDKWLHCNDSSVALASKTDAESAVLDSEGAYLLFYVRKDKSY